MKHGVISESRRRAARKHLKRSRYCELCQRSFIGNGGWASHRAWHRRMQSGMADPDPIAAAVERLEREHSGTEVGSAFGWSRCKSCKYEPAPCPTRKLLDAYQQANELARMWEQRERMKTAELEKAESTIEDMVGMAPCEKCGAGISSECYGCRVKALEANLARLTTEYSDRLAVLIRERDDGGEDAPLR